MARVTFSSAPTINTSYVTLNDNDVLAKPSKPKRPTESNSLAMADGFNEWNGNTVLPPWPADKIAQIANAAKWQRDIKKEMVNGINKFIKENGGSSNLDYYADWLDGFPQYVDKAHIDVDFTGDGDYLVMARWEDKKGKPCRLNVANWTFYYFPGNCGMIASTNAYIAPFFRGAGIGKRLNKLRCDFAFLNGYKLMICTTIAEVEPQMKLLKSCGWKEVHRFVNTRTDNEISIQIKDLTNWKV